MGGLVAVRGAAPGARWQQGALVALPYTAIVLLTAVLVGASDDLTLGEAVNVEVAFRASLAWLLLLLPAGAVLGALGGLRSRGDVFPIPRPNRTFVAGALVSGVLVLASLPIFFANFPGSDAQPIRPSASGGQPFASQRALDEASSPTATPDLSDTSPPPGEKASPV